MNFLLCLLISCAFAPASSAQTPEKPAAELVETKARDEKPKPEPAPLALALDLAFGATVWQEVRISTHGPVGDLTKLVRDGHYKLELIELILMSARGHRALRDTVKKRGEGARLSRIAADYGLDYDEVHESALAIEELVDREYLPRFRERPLHLRLRQEEP